MPPKRTPAAAPASTTQPSYSSSAKPSPSTKSASASLNTPSTSSSLKSKSKPSSSSFDLVNVTQQVWENYVKETPQRTKLLDAFMGFLVLVGAVQFLYVVVVGNFPFNAFLSGFGACVGQFVLTASLRMQTNPANQKEFASISNERAFADFVFGSLILHFFCVNFIN